MQRRPDQERPPAARLAELNEARARSQATGKHRTISTPTGEYRAIPKRPPGMPQHLDAPPETALRAPRPERTQKQPKKTRRPLTILLGAIGAIFVIIISAIVILLVTASNQASEPAGVAAHFVNSLATQKYDDAYNDLGPNVNLQAKPTKDLFIQQATHLDDTEGQITQDNSNGANLNSDNTWSFTYTITRAKITYTLTITVKQQDPNDNNSWKVASYATRQGPGL